MLVLVWSVGLQCSGAGAGSQSGGGESTQLRGGSHWACAPNLALSENSWKGAVTALRVREGEGVGQFLLLSYADTQYSEETTDKYCEIQNIIYHVRLARLSQGNILLIFYRNGNLSGIKEEREPWNLSGIYFIKINSPSITWHESPGYNCIF